MVVKIFKIIAIIALLVAKTTSTCQSTNKTTTISNPFARCDCETSIKMTYLIAPTLTKNVIEKSCKSTVSITTITIANASNFRAIDAQLFRAALPNARRMRVYATGARALRFASGNLASATIEKNPNLTDLNVILDKNLVALSATSNAIGEVRLETEKESSRLRTLDLSGNAITQLAFCACPDLIALNLSANLMASIDYVDLMEKSPNLATLDLRNNPIFCDELEAAWRYLGERNVVMATNNNAVECAHSFKNVCCRKWSEIAVKNDVAVKQEMALTTVGDLDLRGVLDEKSEEILNEGLGENKKCNVEIIAEKFSVNTISILVILVCFLICLGVVKFAFDKCRGGDSDFINLHSFC